jgi:hypothetical protein
MAGYKRKRTVYDLNFADAGFEGLTVQARSMSLGKFLGLGELARLQDLKGGRKLTPEDMEAVKGLFAMFGKALVSWTLQEEDGTPIPATHEAVMDEEPELMLMIASSWVEAVIGVDADLGKDSTSGPLSQVPPLPMDPLSPSPASLLKLS